MERNLYILSVKYGVQFGRLYFEGEDSEDGKNKFNKLREDIPRIGESSDSYEEYMRNISNHFKKNDFINIRG